MACVFVYIQKPIYILHSIICIYVYIAKAMREEIKERRLERKI